MPDNDPRVDLSTYRIETAEEKIKAAKLLLDNDMLKDSVGRSYYAIFSATRALLALDEVDFAKHAGVIAYFQKEYVKTGKIEVRFSKILQNAFQIRNRSDYDDFYIISRDKAEEQYKNAVEFLDMIKKYIKENNISA